MDDLFGQDIKLDAAGQALVAANGELFLTDGVETGLQDIRLRLLTPLGELFYDIEFGSLVHEWYLEESTLARRQAFEQEIEQRIEAGPRVVLDTVSCSITAYDEKGFSAKASWEFIGEDHPFNLVFTYDGTKKEMVIADVNPRTGL